jgi:hypothetical protein
MMLRNASARRVWPAAKLNQWSARRVRPLPLRLDGVAEPEHYVFNR